MIPVTVLRLPHMENVAFDPMKDITYVMGVSGYVFAYVVRADAPWKSMADLVAAARANPEKISYGSHGIGGTVHLATEELSAAQRVKLGAALDALRHCLEVERCGEIENRAHHGDLVGLARHAGDERPVDLELVDGQSAQV